MSEEGEKTKQKHFVLSVGAVSRGRTTGPPSWGRPLCEVVGFSLLFCLMENTGNFRVERRKMLENP